MPVSDDDIVVVSACRTPIGTFRQSLSSLSAVQLGSTVIQAAISRAGIKPEDVDSVTMGCVLTAGLGQNPARQAALHAGLPVSVSCVTVNKVCSSGLTAVCSAVRRLRLGESDVVVAGGMESMSQCPFYIPRGELSYGGPKLDDGVLKDGLTDSWTGKHMGECAEKTAKEFGLTRAMQDEYAIGSYTKAAQAWKSGAYSAEIVPVTIRGRRGSETIVSEDDGFHKLDQAKMKTLTPAFDKQNGTITAANASSLNDGAAAAVLMRRGTATKMGLTPLARICAYAEAGLEPIDFSLAPAYAMPKVLSQCGVVKEDVALWEINEAFSLTAMACAKQMELNLERVNVHGGAVALGHPIGMSGARLLCHLCHALKSAEKGVIGICNGGGEATAMLLEKL